MDRSCSLLLVNMQQRTECAFGLTLRHRLSPHNFSLLICSYPSSGPSGRWRKSSPSEVAKFLGPIARLLSKSPRLAAGQRVGKGIVHSAAASWGRVQCAMSASSPPLWTSAICFCSPTNKSWKQTIGTETQLHRALTPASTLSCPPWSYPLRQSGVVVHGQKELRDTLPVWTLNNHTVRQGDTESSGQGLS